MTPSRRAILLDKLAEVLSLPQDCAECHPEGGCPGALDCRLELAERVLEVIEREMADG